MMRFVALVALSSCVDSRTVKIVTIASDQGTGSSELGHRLRSVMPCVASVGELFSHRERFAGKLSKVSFFDLHGKRHVREGHKETIKCGRPGLDDCHYVEATLSSIYGKLPSKARRAFNDTLRAVVKRRLVRVMDDMTTGTLVSFVSQIQEIVCDVLAVHVYPIDGSDCDRDSCVLAHKFFPEFLDYDATSISHFLARKELAVIELHRDVAAREFSVWHRFGGKTCVEDMHNAKAMRAFHLDGERHDTQHATEKSVYGDCAFVPPAPGVVYEFAAAYADARRRRKDNWTWYEVAFEDLYSHDNQTHCAEWLALKGFVLNNTDARDGPEEECAPWTKARKL